MKKLLIFFAAVTAFATMGFASGLNLRPSSVGLQETYIIPVTTSRYGSADVQLDVQNIYVELDAIAGVVRGEIDVALPNLDGAIDRLMDPAKRRNLNDYIAYIRGNLTNAWAIEGGEAVEVRVWMRFRNRAYGGNFSKNFNLRISVDPTDSGFLLDVDLLPKRGFADHFEGKIQEQIDDQNLSFNLPQELVDAGLYVEGVTFSGETDDGSFAVRLSIATPVSALPALANLGFNVGM